MIEIKNIKKSYGNGENKSEILKSINIQIKDHSFTVILFLD